MAQWLFAPTVGGCAYLGTRCTRPHTHTHEREQSIVYLKRRHTVNGSLAGRSVLTVSRRFPVWLLALVHMCVLVYQFMYVCVYLYLSLTSTHRLGICALFMLLLLLLPSYSFSIRLFLYSITEFRSLTIPFHILCPFCMSTSSALPDCCWLLAAVCGSKISFNYLFAC